MKRAFLGAMIGLVTAGLSVLQADGPVKPDLSISEPFTHLNLAVFPVHGKDVLPGKNFMTLEEALEKKKMVVHETGSVNELKVENTSADVEVFIQSGDIIKGGKQDRVLAYDLIVSAKSRKVPIASFCVEHGRWRQRDGEDAGQFSKSTGQLPGKALRLAVGSARQQGLVWDKVKQQQDKLRKYLKKDVADPRSPSSLQLTLENKELQEKITGYTSKLEKCIADQPDVIGFALTINGKVELAEIYGSAILCRKMFPKMLRAAAVDAFCEFQPGKRFEGADRDAVRAFLEESRKGKSPPTKVGDRFQVTILESAKHICIETRDRDKDVLVHRSYIGR
jgi:hypothetical protein